MLDFTAIDFETANGYRGSPCSVGLVKVRDGQIVDTRHWLIRPPEKVDWFDAINIYIHGITPEHVADAPRWKEMLPRIVDFIGDDVVVAHNAGFDTGVVRYACAADNVAWPDLKFLCSLVLSRQALALPAYRLPFVMDACGFALENHHDALADARAVVGVLRSIAAREGTLGIDGLAEHFGLRIGHMARGIYLGSVCTASSQQKLTRGEINPDADPGGLLHGRVLVFTGRLMSMTRQLAWDETVRVGGTPELNTTKRTNVLVVGDLNPAVLRPGTTLSGRARKAFQLQDGGQDIELMTEDDFVRALDPAACPDLPVSRDRGSLVG
jgi:DNA polymerase III epsilon subunit-like protein